MRNLFIKKTFLVLVGLLLAISSFVYPGAAKPVDAQEGGNISYLPMIGSGVSVQAADTVIFGTNASWKYFDKGTVPGSGWNKSGFADSTWASGSAPLGYGNGTERTVVSYGSNSNNKYITTYFRKVFSISNPAAFSAIAMDLTIDDGTVVYLNGAEITRFNMPSGTIGNTTLAASGTSKSFTIAVAPSKFLAGNNTLAVEIHQSAPSSSDIAFALQLRGTASAAAPAPTQAPTNVPTAVPTAAPTTAPTAVPTKAPTQAPTAAPTSAPTAAPTAAPTLPPTTGKAWYVSPSGTSSNSGSSSSPWSLSYALGHPAALKPGDVVWVRGGTYSGAFTLKVKGSSTAPITIRAYPGERATLKYDGSYVLDIADSYYVNLWGLEITSSYSSRGTTRPDSAYGIRTNQGSASHHIKFINMVVHDVRAQGISWFQALKDSEIYGSLFYFNGTTQFDHGVYFHNVTGTKYFVDNIVNDNASHGFHGYAETSDKGLNNLWMEGNTFFNNGSVGYITTSGDYGTYKRNILVGGLTRTNNPVITNNYTYFPGNTGTSLNLGYDAGSSGAKVTNNYLMGGQFALGGSQSSLTMSGNTVYSPGGRTSSATNYTSNAWLNAKPTGLKFFVRPNKYENNRANLTIYNWDKKTTIAIPASSLGGINLKAGDRYELRNAQNYYGDVVTGVYDGTALQVPMTGRSVAQPVGLSFKPPSSFPEFGTFVLIVLK